MLLASGLAVPISQLRPGDKVLATNVQTTRHWTKAAALRYGDDLRTSDGAIAAAAGGYVPSTASGWMWDLSIPGGGDHDFYIDTVAGTVLVHNCGPEFRDDTPHIFRDAPGHLSEDTPENRALLQNAVDPANFAGTRGPGGIVSVYRQLLPDGSQVWVEVRNGVEITNDGINEIPRF